MLIAVEFVLEKNHRLQTRVDAKLNGLGCLSRALCLVLRLKRLLLTRAHQSWKCSPLGEVWSKDPEAEQLYKSTQRTLHMDEQPPKNNWENPRRFTRKATEEASCNDWIYNILRWYKTENICPGTGAELYRWWRSCLFSLFQQQIAYPSTPPQCLDPIHAIFTGISSALN